MITPATFDLLGEFLARIGFRWWPWPFRQGMARAIQFWVLGRFGVWIPLESDTTKRRNA